MIFLVCYAFGSELGHHGVRNLDDGRSFSSVCFL